MDAAPDIARTTPAADGLRMPPEVAVHERTLMAWPCRRELWGDQLAAAEREYAGVANAIAAFEPLTMVCGSPEDASRARAALTGAVEVVELPIDDSWMRDMGPIFVVGEDGRRAGVHFGFNAWGEKFAPWDRDAALGARLVEHLGDPCYRAPFVLEGGSIAVDDRGTLITTEQCLLNPNRNPDMDRGAIEDGLREHLGVRTIVWFGDGLVEDRDTDGHVDVIADFAEDGRLLLQSVPEENPNHDACARNHEVARAAGLDVVDFPLLAVRRGRGRARGHGLPEPLRLQRRRDRAAGGRPAGRRGARAHRRLLPESRGGGRPGRGDRLRRRRPALHHPAGAGA